MNQQRVSLKPTPQHPYAVVLAELAAYDQAALVQMRKLIPPASVAKDWSQIVFSVQTITNAVYASIPYARAGKLPEIKKFNVPVAKAEEQMRAAARHGGFTDCARRRA
jgi:hypothetical protein